MDLAGNPFEVQGYPSGQNAIDKTTLRFTGASWTHYVLPCLWKNFLFQSVLCFITEIHWILFIVNFPGMNTQPCPIRPSLEIMMYISLVTVCINSKVNIATSFQKIYFAALRRQLTLRFHTWAFVWQWKKNVLRLYPCYIQSMCACCQLLFEPPPPFPSKKSKCWQFVIACSLFWNVWVCQWCVWSVNWCWSKCPEIFPRVYIHLWWFGFISSKWNFRYKICDICCKYLLSVWQCHFNLQCTLFRLQFILALRCFCVSRFVVLLKGGCLSSDSDAVKRKDSWNVM